MFAILMPILYGVTGFIAGAIGGLLYNLLAEWVAVLNWIWSCGRLRLRISDRSSSYAQHLTV